MNLIPIVVPMSITASETVVPMSVNQNTEVITMQISSCYIVQPADLYEGAYEVTPRLFLQSLDTNNKILERDVTVYEIPISRTSNPQGGQTVLIG